MTLQFKKDKRSKARGGNSEFLQIFCSKCNIDIALYQKDGLGELIRLYIDRFFSPESLLALQAIIEKTKLPALKCIKCNNLVGIPMVYEKENRLAYRLIRGNFYKRKLK
jgi:ribosomal protein S27E